VGDFSFADIAFYMAQLFGERMGAPLDGLTPKLLAWRARLSTRPSVRAVVKPMVDFLAANGRSIPASLAQL
jgi:glutathione S-transferase